MAKRPSVAVVGCGRAGGSIALALDRAGYRIAALWSRSRAGRQRAHRLLDAPVLATPADAAHEADVTFVAVPDDAVAGVAAWVAEGVVPGRRVVHTSGSVSVEALAPAREAGARIGSVHPLQTLPDARRGADALVGAAVAVTCDPSDRRSLHRLVSAWGGRPFPLPDESKTLYHAAAVFASNYVVASLWAAAELLERAGVPNGNALLWPLVRQSVENVAARGAERSITGPVARGDAGVVRRHIDALRANGADTGPILEAYRSLALLTASLAGTDDGILDEVRS